MSQIAIIKNPRFGVMDRGVTMLSFSAYITESSAADQYLGVDEAGEILETYGVADVSELEGKPCWVDATTSTIKWNRAWNG